MKKLMEVFAGSILCVILWVVVEITKPWLQQSWLNVIIVAVVVSVLGIVLLTGK